jgi:Kef-type K+ transport system membrane component KefB
LRGREEHIWIRLYTSSKKEERESNAEYFFFWIADCRYRRFPGTALACSYACTPFTSDCNRKSSRYHYRSIRAWLGKGRFADFDPLRPWACFSPLSRRLEVELERLRGRLLAFVGSAFLVSFGLALLAGYGLYAAGQVVSPLLIAIILVATSLGIVIPVLKDAGESASDFGQLVIAGAMFAEFGSIILLTLFFSQEATSTPTKLVLFGGSALLAGGFAFVVLRLERSKRIAAALLRLQDTTAQIRVRGAFMLLVGVVALASTLGLETILGAFVAGVILRLVDGDRMMTHPQFRQKLEAIGFGVFIPVFFIASGIQFDLAALFSSPATIARVPIFLMAILFVRGIPAFLYRPLVGSRRSVVAGLLQATSLSFIVAASQIGLELGLITKATGAALIAAGLLSVLIFPLLALTILRHDSEVSTPSPN